MGKFIEKLDKKKIQDINEMNENHPSIYTRAEKKVEIPTSTHRHNRQNPKKVHWRDRDAAYWERLRLMTPLGAVMICATLQPFEPLFTDARQGRLPQGGCLVLLGDEWYSFPDIPDTLKQIETQWTSLARVCTVAKRPLTPKEGAALNRAKEFLTWAHAAQGKSRWRDLYAETEAL